MTLKTLILGGVQGDRERSLAIMKDPACGPAGAVALILVLLVKLAALEALAAQPLPLVLAPVLGGGALLALFLTTPYVRPGGLGEVHARARPRRPAVIVVLVIAAAIPMTMGSDGLWMLASVFTTFMLVRAAMLRRLGGARPAIRRERRSRSPNRPCSSPPRWPKINPNVA